MANVFTTLRDHLAPIEDLNAAAQVLSWDQETYMPPGGADARAQQLSTLQTLAHERFVDATTGDLLDEAADAVSGDGADPQSAALLRVTRREYERARRVPSDLVARLSTAVSEAKQAWKTARADDDFAAFAPHLQRLVDLTVEKAEAIDDASPPYDVLLQEYEPGMTTDEVVHTFDALRPHLVDLVDAIADAPQRDASVLRGTYPKAAQTAFGEARMAELGYDFERGRQDESAHPFTMSFGTGDVRVTTRYDDGFFPTAFFSMLHEAGHGIYEQGIDPDLARTPLGHAASLGVHESQSRLYENMVGRSRAFWTYAFPLAQEAFPEALDDADAEAVYRAVNRVEPSLIRVEADEVTYSLHIMLRFELERGLIDGSVAVDDLPALWNDRMDDYLGVVPDTDANGVLQDIHWALGAFGYFPTYALGSLMSAQLMDAIRDAHPNVEAQFADGQFGPLLDWLRTHIHGHGRRFDAPDLLERATGQPLTPAPWLAYAREKFGALYDLNVSSVSSAGSERMRTDDLN